MTVSTVLLNSKNKAQCITIAGMTDAEQDQLIHDHFLFDKPVSPLLLASGMKLLRIL
jgi:creatine kinase